MNAVIYTRINSHNQTESSINGQIQKCLEYAKKNNLTITEQYIDNGFSGINNSRPAFQKMLNDSKNKKFQLVLVYSNDRFARDTFNFVMNKIELKKNGVKIVSVSENLSNGASETLLESIIEKMTEYYSNELEKKAKTEMENV